LSLTQVALALFVKFCSGTAGLSIAQQLQMPAAPDASLHPGVAHCFVLHAYTPTFSARVENANHLTGELYLLKSFLEPNAPPGVGKVQTEAHVTALGQCIKTSCERLTREVPQIGKHGPMIEIVRNYLNSQDYSESEIEAMVARLGTLAQSPNLCLEDSALGQHAATMAYTACLSGGFTIHRITR
jgi:hypothetical protein